jgi:hypothetical protein
MRTTITVAVAILILTATYAMAQEVVVPNAPLPLRATPPGTFFQGKGDQIGDASPSEQYRVLERTSVPTIFGDEQWLRVQSVVDPRKYGWIYGGTSAQPTVTRVR